MDGGWVWPALAALAVAAAVLALLLRELAAQRAALARVEGAVRALEQRSGAAEAAVARDVGEARRVLGELLARQEARQRLEDELWAAARRVEAVLAGARSRGAAGESILAEALAAFPPGLVERDFRVRGKPVEFALVLAGGRRLAVDSKWPAAELLARIEAEADPARRAELVEELERAVARKAREAAQYIDPVATVPWAVAAIPDAAYGLCRRASHEAFRERVILVPYSLVTPYLLTLYSLHLRLERAVDRETLLAALARLEQSLDGLDRVLENSLSRGATMVNNAYGELRRLAGEMRNALVLLESLPDEGAAGDGAARAAAAPAACDGAAAAPAACDRPSEAVE